MIFVGYFVQDVIQIVDRIDDLADVCFLNLGHGVDGQLMDFQSFAVAIRVAVDAVDVVLRMEGMQLPAVLDPLHRPALEHHNRDVYAFLTCGLDPLPQSFEIGRIEFRQIELRLAVQGFAVTAALPGMRCHVEPGYVLAGMGTVWFRVPLRHLPRPHAHEIMVKSFHPFEIGVIIERFRWVFRPHIHEIVPDVGAYQQNGLIILIRKISRIVPADSQRPIRRFRMNKTRH